MTQVTVDLLGVTT